MISEVARLARAGFALHWLHPKSKRPIGNDWAAKPIASAADLAKTYREGNNLGVRTGQFSVVCGLYLHILDLDIRVADEAEVALAILEELFPELDTSSVPTVQSGSGGASRHYYILTDKPFPSKKFAHSDGFAMVPDETKGRDVKKWDWELHLLGTGAQAAIPPSIHPDTGLPYRWLREFDCDMLEMGIATSIPSAAIERVVGEHIVEGGEQTERAQPLGLSDEEIVGVLAELPAAEWFEDRDQWMRVGMALHHETGGSEWAYELWCAHSKSSEKFDPKDQKRVWKSFKNRGAIPFRMASLVAVVRENRLTAAIDALPEETDDLDDRKPVSADPFDQLIDEIMAEPAESMSAKAIRLRKEELEIALGRNAPPKIKKLNHKHAVARVSSKTVILDFHPDGRVTYGSVPDLHAFYENDRVPKDDTTEPVTKAWMRHKQRREYPNGIVFAPEGGPKGAYNHWQGYSVDADASKHCNRFITHLREVFCDGNLDHFEYTMSYFAHMIQKPWEKPGVAIVAKGRKGSGKDTVAEYIGGLFTPHYITVANKDQMVGKFNAHQEKCLLLHVQEGFWAGDKRDEGPLKYLITSPSVMIEPKGMNAFPIASVLRVFISSNERWVVPATEDERRFFVLNVSSKRIKDFAYFNALRDEMIYGGRAALLDMLLTRDISKFEVRDVPDTEALAEQKVEGLKNVERWWFGVLQHGSIEGSGNQRSQNDISQNQWAREHVRVEKNDFRDHYSRWMRSRRYDGEEVSEIDFTKRIKAMVPELEESRPRSGGARLRVFVLPDLDACRRRFEERLGSELQWPEIQADAEPDDDEEDDLVS